jgi:succinate dehydrogenase / fumarate reductase iron-sulfur subunit
MQGLPYLVPIELLLNGSQQADERLAALIKARGASECGNAQNCQKACPKNIPLVTSIADINRQLTVRGLFGWLTR